MAKLPDSVVMAYVRDRLGPAARAAIIECARRGYGSTRNIAGVLAVAQELEAVPRVVAAAMGFLPDARNPERYVDVLADDECTIALLPTDATVTAAFALSRAVHPGGCAFVQE